MSLNSKEVDDKTASWEVMRFVSYNKNTGEFVWKTRGDKSFDNRLAGKKAGSLSIGYLIIRIKGCNYYAHRLAWLIIKGRWPTEIDHIDLDKSNNKWDNLRECSRTQNLANRKQYHRKVGTGLPKGVFPESGKFFASIKDEKKTRRIGLFKTPEEAHAAYVKAAKKLHGEFANTV